MGRHNAAVAASLMQSDSQGDAYSFERLKFSQALIFGDSWTKKF
jgi:hypothetical protein